MSCMLLSAAALPCHPVLAQSLGATQPLAALAGNSAKNPPGLYGTDLGFSFVHGDQLWLLFGDSWQTADERYLGDFVSDFAVAGDDAIGFIDLTRFRSGADVEAFARANQAANGLSWELDQPLLQTVVADRALPITLFRGGREIKHMGPGQTPVTGFSNGRKDSSAGAFGIFFRNEPLKCSAGCGTFSCDSGLGRCVEAGQSSWTAVSAACVIGQTPRHALCDRCVAVQGSGGFCQDTGSSMYDTTPRGRASAVVVTQEVGCATDSNNLERSEPSRSWDTRPWNTHRFFNAMARTVNDFDPSRAAGAGNDFSTADGVSARNGVFVWGRPHFGGRVDAQRDVQLYLAYVPMPSYAADGGFSWTPQYFAGLDAQGRPQLVEHETESVALPLDGPNDSGTSEVVDVVGQLNISYIPSLDRWVMIYGGGLSEEFGGLIFLEDWPAVVNDRTNNGPLYIRTAAHPWGPWTAPKVLVDPGDPNVPSGLYAQDGVLYSPRCSGQCVESESAWTNPGGLYGPNIIEPWTTKRADSVDLYWNLSTWNPYAVVLMKTTLANSQ